MSYSPRVCMARGEHMIAQRDATEIDILTQAV